MIGKAERGPAAIEAIRKHQAAYLMAVGGAAYLVSKAIRQSRVVGFADLGMEAIYEFDVQGHAGDRRGRCDAANRCTRPGPREWQAAHRARSRWSPPDAWRATVHAAARRRLKARRARIDVAHDARHRRRRSTSPDRDALEQHDRAPASPVSARARRSAARAKPTGWPRCRDTPARRYRRRRPARRQSPRSSPARSTACRRAPRSSRRRPRVAATPHGEARAHAIVRVRAFDDAQFPLRRTRAASRRRAGARRPANRARAATRCIAAATPSGVPAGALDVDSAAARGACRRRSACRVRPRAGYRRSRITGRDPRRQRTGP